MNWLRPILLLAGAVFMALLIWWERRRPHRVRGGAYSRSRLEPQLNAAASAGASAAEHGGVPGIDRAPGATPQQPAVAREPSRAPQPADRPPMKSRADQAPAARAPGRHAQPVYTAPVRDPRVQAPPVHAQPATSVEPAAPATEPPMVVDWPEEGARCIVTLRILPARHDRLAGRALRQGLTASGFRHGAFGIFHLPEQDGRVVLSAASLVRPGMLDPATMDFQRFAGINLFAVLPGPVSAEQALQRLGQVAVELASRVEGQVQEESGAPFNATAVASWRGRCLEAIGGARSAAGPPH